jgi:23S rRNA (cytosine1962-C5)-methyltransferase
VVTVDMSKTYLNWAEKNFALNADMPAIATEKNNYTFVQADVLQYLKTIPAGSFDLIIMDPPTFSNSKRMEDFLEIQRDHVSLINDCMAALKPGGQLYFSTNFRKFILDTANIKASTVKDITRATTPFDFEGKLFRYCYYLVK